MIELAMLIRILRLFERLAGFKRRLTHGLTPAAGTPFAGAPSCAGDAQVRTSGVRTLTASKAARAERAA